MLIHHSLLVLTALLLPTTIFANTEKVIFLGPSLVTPDTDDALLQAYNRLPRLNPPHLCPPSDPKCFKLETTWTTSFDGLGKEHWAVFDHLEEEKRYEARICWPATNPTDFTMEVYTQEELLKTQVLHDAVVRYALNRTAGEEAEKGKAPAASTSHGQISRLYLRTFAKAAYFSAERELMENPEPVELDLILDPFLFNVLPESLVPTVIWIGGVLVFSILLSRVVWRSMNLFARDSVEETAKEEGKKLK